jgi:NAD(P)-dependent dehydrogenase (short-subunit alcohol dehydrogenase family)
MNINKLIVFGSTSSIAKVLLPNLGIAPSHILSFDRVNSNQVANTYLPQENQYQSDWNDASEIESFVLATLHGRLVEPVLVLNFMGLFGQIEKIQDIDIGDVLLTNSKNLLPFLLAGKIARFLPKGSRILSFSGAGVGGDNLDDSSLGYLAAKASMAILVESIDRQLTQYDVRFGLIAPGAFPSRMQEAVAQVDSTKIPLARVSRAKEVMSGNPAPEKLLELISFLANNPHLLGGRTWSANFDELTERGGNFGKLRRIF